MLARRLQPAQRDLRRFAPVARRTLASTRSGLTPPSARRAGSSAAASTASRRASRASGGSGGRSARGEVRRLGRRFVREWSGNRQHRVRERPVAKEGAPRGVIRSAGGVRASGSTAERHRRAASNKRTKRVEVRVQPVVARCVAGARELARRRLEKAKEGVKRTSTKPRRSSTRSVGPGRPWSWARPTGAGPSSCLGDGAVPAHGLRDGGARRGARPDARRDRRCASATSSVI